MNDIDKTPRKLTSLEFHGIKWQLQKCRATMEYKLENENKSLEIGTNYMAEYHEKQIVHLNGEIKELSGLINAFHVNRSALYDLPKSDA
jgi:hypothetical protein